MPVEAGTDFPKAGAYLPMEIETSAVVSPMFSLAEKILISNLSVV
jgi:hypothetical protein